MNHDPISRATPGGAAADRRTGVGGLLRASRLRCGEDLDVIAQVLRIRRRHLQAIEDGNFDQLPGTTYAVGFIRTYADYLGLDSDEVVRRFKGEQTLQPGKTPKSDLIFPSPMSETGIPRGAVVFLGVVIGVIAYGGWYSSTVDNDFFKQWIEPVPARLAALLPGGAENDGPDHSQAVAADKPMSEPVETAMAPAAPAEMGSAAGQPDQLTATTEAASEPVPQALTEQTQTDPVRTDPAPATEPAAAPASAPVSETADVTPTPEAMAPAAGDNAAGPAAAPVTETVRPPESIAQPVETAELPAPAPQAPAVSDTPAPAAETSETTPTPAAVEVASTPAETAEARIVLTAINDSWVEVREQGTDTWIWGKLLRAGESYAVPDRPDLKLKTGNAGGLTIRVDGDGVPSVGASGEVVRNVLLDPERLKAGTAVFR
ncbi:MAG: DUF4115 domain-containing protein [Rhodospirillales bacterium]